MIMNLFLIVGCQNGGLIKDIGSNNEEKEQNYEKNELPMANSGEEGFSLGLYGEDSKIVSDRSFKITHSQNSFHKKLVLGNKASQEEEFVLIIFDHGKQVNFQINSDNKNESHYIFKVKKGDYKDINVKIKDLKDGFHAINYLILRSPNEKITDLSQALSYSQVFNIRINILKNIDTIPTIIPKNRPTAAHVSNNGSISNILIGEPSNPHQLKLVQDRDDFKYNTSYGNKLDTAQDFYVVSLLNWKQINVYKDIDSIYDKLNVDQEVSFASNMREKQLKEGKNILVNFILPNPFQNLDPQNPYVTGKTLSSNRVFIKE